MIPCFIIDMKYFLNIFLEEENDKIKINQQQSAPLTDH